MEIEICRVRLRACKRLVEGLLPPEKNRHLQVRARAVRAARAKVNQWLARRERVGEDEG